MKTLESALRGIERVSSAIAMCVMVAIMVIVVADVFLRYAFHRPLSWTYDFISLYLMAALFYFVLSVAYESKSLVSIDMLYERFSERGKTWSRLVTNVSAIALFVLIAYSSGIRAYDEFVFGDVSGGVIPWPSWISAAIVTAGTLLLALRMALEILQAALALSGQAARPTASHAIPAACIPTHQPTGSDLS